MNPNVEPPLPALAPPPQPPQPHRLSTSCDRHPQENFTGFCPSCLCERLAVLEPATPSSSSSRKPPIAAAALKAIFKSSAAAGSGTKPGFFPELRRTQSFSASKNEGFSGVFEPQRKSCDVRGRNTLWNLIHQEATAVTEPKPKPEPEPEPESVQAVNKEDIIEIIEEEEVKVHHTTTNTSLIEEEYENQPVQTNPVQLKPMKDHIDLDSQTKKGASRGFWSAASVFSKKLQKWRQKQKLKKDRNRGGGSARLPVEKPLGRQYRETQSEIADYGFGRRSCDTDPRFSLDAARMSFDAARMSFDDPRYSFDEPRASWDGYLIGKILPPRMPSMLSVVEDAPVQPAVNSVHPVQQAVHSVQQAVNSVQPVQQAVHSVQQAVHSVQQAVNSVQPVQQAVHSVQQAVHSVHPVQQAVHSVQSVQQAVHSVHPVQQAVHHVIRTDTQIPVEDPDESVLVIPGGSVQTRDYYSDSFSRRRKSLDRSCSSRKSAASIVSEMDEPKPVSNARVSPTTVEYFRDSNSNSLRDDYSDTFEIGLRDNNASVINNAEQKESSKKSRRWSKGWNIWGLINRKSVNKDDDEDKYSRANGMERSYSESWPELRGERKVTRSNSSVSWRNSSGFVGGGSSFSGARKSCVEFDGHNGGSSSSKKKKDDFGLERNRSARYSPPKGIDNGLLRFYMAPMNGSRRSGSGKTRASHAHSIARTLLRLY